MFATYLIKFVRKLVIEYKLIIILYVFPLHHLFQDLASLNARQRLQRSFQLRIRYVGPLKYLLKTHFLVIVEQHQNTDLVGGHVELVAGLSFHAKIAEPHLVMPLKLSAAVPPSVVILEHVTAALQGRGQKALPRGLRGPRTGGQYLYFLFFLFFVIILSIKFHINTNLCIEYRIYPKLSNIILTKAANRAVNICNQGRVPFA